MYGAAIPFLEALSVPWRLAHVLLGAAYGKNTVRVIEYGIKIINYRDAIYNMWGIIKFTRDSLFYFGLPLKVITRD